MTDQCYFSRNNIDEFIKNKLADINALKAVRLSAQAEKAELTEKAAIFAMQSKIVEPVLQEEEETWNLVSREDADELYRVSKRLLVENRERKQQIYSTTMKAIVRITDLMAEYFDRSSPTVLLSLEDVLSHGSKDLKELIGILLDAYMKGDGEHFVSVDNYHPPMIASLVSAGILMVHPRQPELVRLTCRFL